MIILHSTQAEKNHDVAFGVNMFSIVSDSKYISPLSSRYLNIFCTVNKPWNNIKDDTGLEAFTATEFDAIFSGR